jgi:hypothetical protein
VSVRVCALRLCRSLLPPVSPKLLDAATDKLGLLLLDSSSSSSGSSAHAPSNDADELGLASSSHGFAITMLRSIGATLNVWGRVLQG